MKIKLIENFFISQCIHAPFNWDLIKISYETLFCFDRNRKNKYNIIKAYGEFNKSNMIFNGQ